MPGPVLATAGESIKVWSDKNYELSHHIINRTSNYSSICWSPDASAPSKSDKLQIHYFKGRSSVPMDITPEVPQTFVRYGSTSCRYILSCTYTSPNIYMWDLKTRKVIKNFQTSLNTGITCAAYSHGDTHIACGGRNGAIVLLNVVSSVALAPLVAADVQRITGLRYSYLHRDLMGAVSEDGACNLWNCNYRTLVKSFQSAHLAPASGIAFSPINEMLLITVGFDKRMIFYDSLSKKTLLTQDVDEPLTSVDFTPDGTCVAVGTTRGSVFIYDLRSSSSPLHNIKAHATSVQALCYKRISTSKGSSKSNFSKDIALIDHPIISKPDVMLSPVLDNSVEKILRHVSPCSHQSHDVNIIDVLSPIQSNELGAHEPASPVFTKVSPRLPQENAVDHHFYPLAPARLVTESESPSKITLLLKNSAGNSTVIPDEKVRLPITPESLEQPQSIDEIEKLDPVSSSKQNVTTAELSKEIAEISLPKLDASLLTGPSPVDYKELLDTINDMHFSLHTDIINHNAVMMKEIFFVQLAVEAIAKKCEVVDELVKENQRLREENNMLKKKF